MLSFMYCGRKVTIDLPTGIFSFGNESAQGKTFLYKIIRSKSSLTEIVAFSYSDLANGADYKKVIREKKPRYVLFDRYDLSKDLLDTGFIRTLSQTTSVLLDNKHDNRFWDVEEICAIHLDRESLEVACNIA